MRSETEPKKLAQRMASRAPPRQKFAAARAFYLAILVISILTVWRLAVPGRTLAVEDATSQLQKRTILQTGDGDLRGTRGGLVQRDEECRLVHAAEDQCAFVRANCPDEEAGLLSYLQLYYCKLPNAKPVAFIILILWLGLLFSTIGIAASDFFCINLSTIASILGMSESMAGVTFLAFGNGSPDVFSTFAAMKTHSGSLAVGELIGAAGFITAVVAGSMALVRPFKVARKSFVRDVGFFIVAASFSMVFLADGRLHMWECAVMVGFYVFYVVIVVVWHWYLKKRSRRMALEDAARSHFHVPGAEEADVEPYRDDEDEEVGHASSGPSRTISGDDFANLERGGSPMLRPMDEEADADGETRDRYLAEISSNMRVSRPKRGERRNTINPIRPSLVGALEFRAVLSSLQKSRSIQTIPINLRRYSDDPMFTLAQQQDHLRSRRASNPNVRYEEINARDVAHNAFLGPAADSTTTGPHRVRAVSTSDAVGLRRDSRPLQIPDIPQIDLTNAPDSRSVAEGAPEMDPPPGIPKTDTMPSAALSVSSPQGEFGYMASSPVPMTPSDRRQSGDLLALPGDDKPRSPGRYQQHLEAHHHGSVPPEESSGSPTKPAVPKLRIPGSKDSSQLSSPVSAFPEYHDDPNFMPTRSRAPSIRLPPPSIGSESDFHRRLYQEPEDKPLKWWPYKILPQPQVLVSTLFPTLYSWHEKNIWEKMLGVVAAPSIFILAITLPIVESDKGDDESEMPDPDPGLLSPENDRARSGTSTLVPLALDSPSQSSTGELQNCTTNVRKHGNNGSPSPVINVTAPQDHDDLRPSLPQAKPSHLSQAIDIPSPQTPTPPSSPKEWNRWLVATQLFTAPLFVLLLIHANFYPSEPRALILPTLCVLIGSLSLFALLLLFTTPDRAPKYRHGLCYLGFVVAIAWISTIAGEVVGVLKALGIILNISDAILGLTIFAVGNSLGDLVADITVARLGYPVMALSACFGGPMLNILLGIGISGLYMTIHGGERRQEKHPGSPMKYKPYHIEIGGTLIISGVTLLVTLLGLLIVVPLRGWWMDRKVGWGLIILWTLSTIGNVIVEVVGWSGEIS